MNTTNPPLLKGYNITVYEQTLRGLQTSYVYVGTYRHWSKMYNVDGVIYDLSWYINDRLSDQWMFLDEQHQTQIPEGALCYQVQVTQGSLCFETMYND